MYTTFSENGILNNYSKEPSIYYANYPDFYQRRQYVKLGALATLLVSTLIMTAFLVS